MAVIFGEKYLKKKDCFNNDVKENVFNFLLL